MSPPDVQQRSLLRGPILLGQLFATVLAVGYAFAGISMSIYSIFAISTGPHRTLGDIMRRVMWLGGFTTLAASGLTTALVVLRCCLFSHWSRSGPAARAARLERLRSRYRASCCPCTRALVALWLAPIAMLDSMEAGSSRPPGAQQPGGASSSPGGRNPGVLPSSASATASRTRAGAVQHHCSSQDDDDVESAATLLLRCSPVAVDPPQPATTGAAADPAACDTCDGVDSCSNYYCYVPLPGAPPLPLLAAEPPVAPGPTAADYPAHPGSATTSGSKAGGGTPTAPAAPPPPPPPPPAHSSSSPGLGSSRVPASSSRGGALVLVSCFGAEAVVSLAPVLLHGLVVGLTVGVLVVLGARVDRDPWY
ncbi:hypothetical protein HXX76_012933 [Chlamydomonas incerta]|uniref:Uncharacterized protein n=1 Tax=Chlamydomonas incerta TaxID=51695 RepID=A0A835SN68_CHLIN|nr:hypothetical protein HXX76_012933 [Chlamydomonas incerta]|eukprot:KAG2426618.1 hypothetical protein HXX76_012933 [Chlamydomonas incerta]